MDNFDNMLDKYAKLAVEVGVNIQKNQTLVINSPIECTDFARLLAKHAYALGAKDVHVEWYDEEMMLMRYMNAPYEVFTKFPKWQVDKMEGFAEEGAAFISVLASDPELLKDVDPKKIAEDKKTKGVALKGYMDRIMADEVCWSVVSVPTKGWAKKVFDGLPGDEAVDKLWKAIFKTVRADHDDIITAWQQHLDNLERRVKFLNEKRFKTLHYISEGTDLTIDLPPDHIWCGGGEYSQKDVYFVANIPTEEVFTLPHKTGVNGKVRSTMPLNYNGNLIEGFSLTFKDGKVVDFSADRGYDILKGILETDAGSLYLGEVALVPYDSPISNLDIIFYNTLFDENASCHLALGAAYPTCLKGGAFMSRDALKKAGVNDSAIHEDFMIGSNDLDIIGITADGKKMHIFKDGNWAF
ncbi:aminopeptidase [Xylanivirga thermophila]|uniref:aminopeptidase n=1 Tax=Xylanivirga thermophila TaxID=2496273 RepID=UPI00101C4132|nr:aminopeptidase [Xylanivirga thermophila]